MNLTTLISHGRATAGQPRSLGRRRLGLALAALASSAFLGGGALAGSAVAGIVPVTSCHLTATVTLAPPLTSIAHNVGGNIQGTLSGCSLQGAALPDTGQLFVSSLTGSASTTSESLSGGQATIIWPASANLNPSVANFSVSVNANRLATYSGKVLAGAFKGLRLHGQYKINSQSTVNQGGYNATVQMVGSPATGPLQILENLG